MKQYYKIINDKIVFFTNPLIVGDMQIINPSEEQLLENGWTEWLEPTPSQEELLEEAKKEKLAEIEVYDNSDAVNSFSLNGQDMWLDAATRQQLRISIMAYQSLGKTSATKWFNGNDYTFSITQWISMLDLLEVYAAESLNTTESHKAAINEMTTIQEISDYDITADYPQKIIF